MIRKGLKVAIERGNLKLSFFKKILYAAGMVILGLGFCGPVSGYKADAQESGSTALTAPKPFELPADETLQKYIRTPIQELLREWAVPVNDENYPIEVFGADRPVLVVFAARPDQSTNGLGALVKVLHANYPRIKVCFYNLGQDVQASKEELWEALMRLNKKYPVRDLPYLVFYRFRQGKVAEMPGDYNFRGGVGDVDKLKYWVREYGDMPKGLW
jgi:hypothetical protein